MCTRRFSRDRGETETLKPETEAETEALTNRCETETKAFRARDRDEAEAYQLRGETEPRHYCASRRPRDRGVKTEATYIPGDPIWQVTSCSSEVCSLTAIETFNLLTFTDAFDVRWDLLMITLL